MRTASTLLTADEFMELSFESPTELVRGEVVSMTNPGPRHGLVCGNVYFVIRMWDQGDQYFALTNDSAVLIEQDPDTLRGPDVLAIRRDRLPQGKLPQKYLSIPPDVAVEVRSPSDRWSEILEKVSEYLLAGVLEVWVLDPESHHLHVYRADQEPLRFTSEEVFASTVLPGLACSVATFFQGVPS